MGLLLVFLPFLLTGFSAVSVDTTEVHVVSSLRVGWDTPGVDTLGTSDVRGFSRVGWGDPEVDALSMSDVRDFSRVGWDAPEVEIRYADALRAPPRIAWAALDVGASYESDIARIGWDIPRFGVFDERGLGRLPSDTPVTGRVGLVTGGLGAGNTALYVYQRHAWWAEEHRAPFHFHSDRGYSAHLDKIGHMHATYLQAQLVARSLRWSGLSPEASALWGSVAAWTVQLNVEINDGFNNLWGFDVLDVVGNTVGAAWFYARERMPELRPFVLKFNYWPSGQRIDLGEDFAGRLPSPVDDYMGHNYWVSMRVYDLLPESSRRIWPEWLSVAVGVTAEQLYTEDRHRAYYIALDLDLERIIPVRTWLAAVGLEALNFIKLPAPAIRIYPRFQPFLLYYGQYSPP